MNLFAPELGRLEGMASVGIVGRVSAVRGLTVIVNDLTVPVGSLVRIGSGVLAEVVGSARGQTVTMLLGQASGIRARDPVELVSTSRSARVGEPMLGRIVNGLGEPIDGGEPFVCRSTRDLDPVPIGPMQRSSIDTQLLTGVRAVDLMTPIGRGQRMGIFAGPGVGKSTLLGQMARSTDADISVIALIGERGREVRDFVEHALGEEGLKRSVVVCATGDESPPMRLRAAKLACAAAEYFRDSGRDVLLVMDSVTRLAHAQRQIGLSVGEPPATRGYTPSVFSEMALLLERAGSVQTASGSTGSITGMYTILVEGDDATEPISDAARGILDGHLMLSRKLAQKGHFPAIDVLDSVSRVCDDVTDGRHRNGRQQVLRVLAAYREVEELVQIGAYASGSDPESDVSIEFHKPIEALLQQGRGESGKYDESREVMIKLGLQTDEMIDQLGKQQAGARAAAARQAGNA